MRIGIDARMMGPAQAGLGRYVEQLVKHLLEIDRENQYVLFVRELPRILASPPPPRRTGRAGGGHVRFVVADIPWYGWEEQVKFPAVIKKENIDLMHFPHWNVPLLFRGPYVVTVHDLIMWHYSRQKASTHGPLVYWIKDFFSRVVVRHAVKKAKQVIVTSEFTKQDVHRTLGVPLEKMTVTYQAPFRPDSSSNGCSAGRASAPRLGGSVEMTELNTYGIRKPYVLYVGNAYPHKNLERLIEAWKKIEEKYGDAYQLVLVGKENFFYQRLKHVSCLMSHVSSVIFTDFVPDEGLEDLYRGAGLYVFPSLYEGFGLPPLEAMTYGVPIASSNASCLPEALGEAAAYFDPENVGHMAEVIGMCLTDAGVRDALRARAPEELKRYSWASLAERTRAIYTIAISC